MRLEPRYGTEPALVLDGDPAAIGPPTIRQRRRLLDELDELDAADLASPSRCAAWSAIDVVSHLDGTNGFWSLAIDAAVAAEPSTILAGFDPVTTPAAMVEAGRARSDAEVLTAFRASTLDLVDRIAAIPDDAWQRLGEAPPGHLTLSGVLHHALWDSWCHERDILLPLGRSAAVEPDEVRASLRYAVALGPTLGHAPSGGAQVTVRGHDPDVEFVVDVAPDRRVSVVGGTGAAGSPVVEGSSVELLEAFSARRALPAPPEPSWRWLLDGPAAAFDQTS